MVVDIIHLRENLVQFLNKRIAFINTPVGDAPVIPYENDLVDSIVASIRGEIEVIDGGEVKKLTDITKEEEDI